MICPKLRSREVFRVGIHDGAEEFRLKFEGRFAADDVREAEQCWQTAASTIAGRRFVIDLTEVTSLDPGARPLLARMSGCGAELIPSAVRPRPVDQPNSRHYLKEISDLLACLLLRWRT